MRVMKVRFGKRAAAEKVPGFVYCARAYGGFDESPLHNPFKLGRDGTLPEVLQKFDTHLRIAAGHNGEIKAALEALTPDSVLGCWCINKGVAGRTPWTCHCDVIATLWYELYGENNVERNRSEAVAGGEGANPGDGKREAAAG